MKDLGAVEASAIQVKIKNKLLKIVSAYYSPSVDKKSADKFAKNDFDKIFGNADTVFCAGDFNAKYRGWGCRVNNIRGKKLNNYCQNKNLMVCASDNFTHFPFCKNGKPKNPDLLDFAITKNFNYDINASTIYELDSDHFPVLFQINLKCNSSLYQPKINTNQTDWDKFNDFLWEAQPNTAELHSKNQIDNAVTEISNNIKLAIEASTPHKTFKKRNPPLPEHILNLMKQRNKIKSNSRRKPDIFANKQINSLRKQIDSEIQKHRINTWTKKIENLKIKDHTLWQTTKMFTRTKTTIPPLKDNNGKLRFFSRADKANKLASYLASTMTPHSNPSIPEFIKETDSMVDDFVKKPCSDKSPTTSASKIKKFFSKTKNKKSPGEDGITNYIMKKLPLFYYEHISNIFNACFKLCYFPRVWKNAVVLVLYKGGSKDQTLASSYRPISLLNTMSKALEAIFCEFFDEFLVKNGLYDKDQFGFRFKHSTVQQILRVTEHITLQFNQNRNTGAVFLDVAKAFDSVWHNGAIRRLIESKFPDTYIHFLNSYLKERTFVVCLDGYTTKKFPILSGVPQGSLIGPKLFIFYMLGLPSSNSVKKFIYADDTALMFSSWSNKRIVKSLNEYLSQIHEWCTKWRIKINADKSEAILIGQKNKNRNINPPELNGTKINWKPAVKYLGVTLDQKLTYSKHVQSINQKASGQINKLFPILKNPALTYKNGTTIYKMLIRPIISYAGEVWGNTSKSNWSKMQRIQNRALKLITNAPRYTRISRLHKDLNVEYLRDFVVKQTKNFYERNKNSNFDQISGLGKYEYDPGIKYKRPKDFIY